jgi:hypothetical protein
MPTTTTPTTKATKASTDYVAASRAIGAYTETIGASGDRFFTDVVNAAAEALPAVKPVVAKLAAIWQGKDAQRVTADFPIGEFVKLMQAADERVVVPNKDTDKLAHRQWMRQTATLLAMALNGHGPATVQQYRMVALEQGQPALTVSGYVSFLRRQDDYNADGTIKESVTKAREDARTDAASKAKARRMVRLLPKLVIDQTFLGTSEDADEQDVYLAKLIHELTRTLELRLDKAGDEYTTLINKRINEAIDLKVARKS